MRAGWQAAALWTCVSLMPADEIARKAMYVQRKLFGEGKDCWLGRLSTVLRGCGSNRAENYWHEWFSEVGFRVRMDRSEESDGKIKVIKWEEDILDDITIESDRIWRSELGREKARGGQGRGGNKLRTYARFKTEIGVEGYLGAVCDRAKRCLMARFRMGVAPLRIEYGRYESHRDERGKARRGIPPEERICPCCGVGVEDEVHFLMTCPCYTDLRGRMLDRVRKENGFAELGKGQVVGEDFINIMGSQVSNVNRAVADFLWQAFQKREEHLRPVQQSQRAQRRRV